MAAIVPAAAAPARAQAFRAEVYDVMTALDRVVVPDTGTTVLRFGLEAGAYELPELETTATRASILDRAGFTDRARAGFGHFVDPEVWTRRGPR